ncbi:MAG: hypothetical protein ACPG5L_09200 [Vibrio gallaecicus]|uniref:Lipoprotein n=1 Tax=Vibrio gallaecicus TaxID=552386 RepID=A0ABV4N8R9_9VIBR|nr:hypothetical protein [Vibrio gallaecicus]MDN3614374.1 hypothetical protein [Vibrio gallaecicus]
MKSLKIVISLFFILILAGCGRVQPVMNVEDTPVALNLQSKQVKSAIYDSAIDRGWLVSEIKPGLLRAELYVRSHHAVIEIPYSDKFYSILYVESENLKYADGNIHRNYNRWINNLNVDIKRKLAVMAAQ